MAYYQDVPGKRPQKRNHADEGSWDDEGSHYRPASRRFGPESGAPREDRPRRGGYRDGHASYAPPTRGDFRRGNDRQRDERSFNDRGRDSRPSAGISRSGRTGFRRDDRPRTARPADRRPRPEAAPRPVRPARRFRRRSDGFLSGSRVPADDAAADRADGAGEPARRPQSHSRGAQERSRPLRSCWCSAASLSGSAREIVQTAKAAHIIVQEVDKVRLDELAPHHQGMIAFASAYQYATVEAMLEEARAKDEPPFLILLDGVTDPHNLGAIIRSAECVGAHGVIVPERRSVGLTPAAVKASAGAIEHMKVARVTNLNRTMEELKKQGVWTYAVTMDGEDYETVDFKGGVALVIGSGRRGNQPPDAGKL